VLPVNWYRQAFASASRGAPAGMILPHSIQTNGMLVDDAWCGFFQEHAVCVGVSLDGPAWLHDARRRTRSGKGTHAQVMKGIDTLRRNGVPFHVICVVGAQSIDAVDELIDFFIAEEIHDVGFNIEEIEGVNCSSTLQQSDIDARFRSFFGHLLDRAQAADPPLAVREREELLATLRHPSFGKLTHNSQNEPFGFVSVSSRGGIYTFSPELAGLTDPQYGDMAIGQLPGADLASVLAAPAFQRMWTDIEAGTAMCRKACAYFDLCLGGAPVNKLAELGTFAGSETLHCRLSHQAIADSVLLKLETDMNANKAMASLQGHRAL
jgi:uncharacterized protein